MPYQGRRSSNYSPYPGPVNSNTPASVKCRIWWNVKTSSYNISTPWSKEFVEFLKLAIPVSDRAYDPTTKIWTFVEKHLGNVEFTARKVWPQPGEVVVESKDAAEQEEAKKRAEATTHVHKAPIASVLNEFLMLLPNDALVAAYRRAAMELHPDKQGGSGDKMAYLNTLWERIKVEKGI